MSLFSRSDVGVDLGTSTTLVYIANEGIVLREPSVVAMSRDTGEIVAIGEEARTLTGRAPEDVVVIRPLCEGVVSNFDAAARMLSYFFQKAVGKRLTRPRCVVCVPSGVTQAERHCVVEAVLEAGARYAYLIEEPLAAAIGANEDVLQSAAKFVLDIGGGTTDIAVLSCGCVVLSDCVRVAGDAFDAAIRRYMRHKHALSIGNGDAEDIKRTYARAFLEKEQRIVELRGRSAVTGLIETVRIGTNELVDALSEPLAAIADCARGLLGRIPPQMADEIQAGGAVLTGGGSLLAGMADYMTARLGVPCRVAEDPVGSVARGAGIVLENPFAYNAAVRDYRRGDYGEG